MKMENSLRITNNEEIITQNVIERSNSDNNAISEATCSKGWVKDMVQGILATMTIASFIFILIWSLNISFKKEDTIDKHTCAVRSCGIQCRDMNFHDVDYEVLTKSAMEIGRDCGLVYLTLKNMSFHNGIMKSDWLNKIKTNIFELKVYSGNLKVISNKTFSNSFGEKLKSLDVESVTLSEWTVEMLQGLCSLKYLTLRNVDGFKYEANFLNFVSDTLEQLTITNSGYWNPRNLTGASKKAFKLIDVNFSYNNFSNLIDKQSFLSLQHCEVLNLSHNRITTIGVGAFDNLKNIKILYLHSNQLVTLSQELFRNLMFINPETIIDLTDNPCCYVSITSSGISLAKSKLSEPICNSPEIYRAVTLKKLLHNYDMNSKDEKINKKETSNEMKVKQRHKSNTIDGIFSVYKEHEGRQNISFISPINNLKCMNSLRNNVDSFLINQLNNSRKLSNTNSSWVQPTLYVQEKNTSMLAISSKKWSIDNALIWYKSSWPSEVYCIAEIPLFLKIYDIDIDDEYIFCPLSLNEGLINSDYCSVYIFDKNNEILLMSLKVIWLLLFTATLFLLLGALIIFTVVRKNPTLLKGSKRVLVVRHKLDDLVLTQKNCLHYNKFNTNFDSFENFPQNNLFKPAFSDEIVKNSYRSYKSIDSYISVLLPSDKQLMEWRSNYFEKKPVSTESSEVKNVFPTSYDPENAYLSLDRNSDIMYNSLK